MYIYIQHPRNADYATYDGSTKGVYLSAPDIITQNSVCPCYIQPVFSIA